MTAFDVELVGKIGSMALINKKFNDIDYNVIARVSGELRPGFIWVTSGATEIGRLDYIKRNAGVALEENDEDAKADYSSQGQTILMANYRNFVDSKYSIRQILVEHQHFNDPKKRERLRQSLIRAGMQNAIPIINYNDAVSYDENRKLEIAELRSKNKKVVECIDNDETAAQIAILTKPKYLLLLTSVEGIFTDVSDKNTLVKEICGANDQELLDNIAYYQNFCDGSSRKGANGARAKLEYIKEAALQGTTVFIASSQYSIKDILSGTAPRTVIHKK